MSATGLASLNVATASDSGLVRAARAGEDDAFEELYRRYHGQIAAFARRIVRDHGRGEDVAQEAFVSALRRMRQTDCEIQFKPWIYGIARNAAIDSYRRAGRVEEISLQVHAGLAAADAVQLPGLAAPEASVISRERFENFRGALDELSESHHRIIVMRELEGLSYREIGVRMRLTPAAVESTLFRARRKLEHEYAQLDTGRRCQAIGALIARLAEGVESRRDRVRLDRHARRCARCRARARRMGVEPVLARSVCRRAAAFLPLPGFLRRSHDLGPMSGPAGSPHEATAVMATPGFETAVQGVSKAAAVVVSALAIGGGGATLGGVGPLAVEGDRAPVQKRSGERESSTSSARGTAPARGKRPDLRRPAPTADGRKKPQRSKRGRAPGTDASPLAPAPPGSSAPSPGAVPNAPPAGGPKISIPALQLAPPRLPVLPRPSLPAKQQELRLPEPPVLPTLGGVPGGTVPDLASTLKQLTGASPRS